MLLGKEQNGAKAALGSSSYFSTFLSKMAKSGPGNILGSLIFILFFSEKRQVSRRGLSLKQFAVAF